MDSRLTQLDAEIVSAIRGITPNQLIKQRDGKWSVAEILEHLFLSYTGTTKGLERCLEAGRPLASKPSLYHRFGTFVVTNLGYFPSGREAPKQAIPKGIAPETLISGVGEQITAMDAVAQECEERFGRRVRILDHPVLGPLTIEQWRKFHALHGHHHCRQILERRAQMEKEFQP